MTMPQRAIRYVCPDCGGPRSRNAERCYRCAPRAHAHARSEAQRGIYSDDTVERVRRRESILTFENERGGTRSVHAYGDGVPAQIADGLRQLPGDGWRVVCRSTPASILADLRGRKLRRQKGDAR